MTVTEMVALFRRHGVPEWFYVTDGGLGTGECVGIEQVAGRWSLYYSERGSKSPLETYGSEASATRAMTARVDAMLRQAGLPPLPAAV
jgi:hypothetical protein